MSKDLVETGKETLPSTNLFGAKEGENFLAKTLGQNFKQVKETQIQDKSEDIERRMCIKIQDAIIKLRRQARTIKDDLIKVIPTSPIQTLNLAEIDDEKFCNGISEWRLRCHNSAVSIISDISIYQSMFGKKWDEEEKTFVKSMIIDFKNI